MHESSGGRRRAGQDGDDLPEGRARAAPRRALLPHARGEGAPGGPGRVGRRLRRSTARLEGLLRRLRRDGGLALRPVLVADRCRVPRCPDPPLGAGRRCVVGERLEHDLRGPGHLLRRRCAGRRVDAHGPRHDDGVRRGLAGRGVGQGCLPGPQPAGPGDGAAGPLSRMATRGGVGADLPRPAARRPRRAVPPHQHHRGRLEPRSASTPCSPLSPGAVATPADARAPASWPARPRVGTTRR